MSTISFDELLAKREQRLADKLVVGTLHIPHSDKTLIIKKPTETQLLHFYGQISAANGDYALMLSATDTMIYHCCDQLQDPKLREALGVSDPLDIVPSLFDIAERNIMGEELMRFLRFLPDDADDPTQENPAKN